MAEYYDQLNLCADGIISRKQTFHRWRHRWKSLTLNKVTALRTGLGDALINIPYERESRHQIRHATVHLLYTVPVYKPHMCHLWDQWLHCVGTVLVHIHNPVPCIMMLNISCIIMECSICMLQQHTRNTVNPLFNIHRFKGSQILWTKLFGTSLLYLVDMLCMCSLFYVAVFVEDY